MNRLIAILAGSLLVSGIASAAPSAKASASPVLLEHATLHTVSHGVVENGSLLIEGGRIAALGPGIAAPAGATRIDLAGLHVYPGYIAANSVLGLTEIGAVRSTNDMSEVGPVNPNVRALVAINPDSTLFGVARANGVLSALVIPRAGNHGLIAGQSALIQLDGWTAEDMAIKDPVGIHLFWPSVEVPEWLPDEMAEKRREQNKKQAALLEQAMRDARAFAAADAAGTVDTPDLRWKAMLPVLRGDLPLIVHAGGVLQIRDALAFLDRHHIDKAILVGGRDAWRVADELARRNIPVILQSANNLPARRWEAYDTPFRHAARLAKAGVRFAIANDGGTMDAANARNLPYQAARYAAYGLGKQAALRAITLAPAEILGVADRLGSLDIGKDATLFVADGPALEIPSNVVRAWIAGHEIDLENRQTRLRDKYQRKYQGLPKR